MWFSNLHFFITKRALSPVLLYLLTWGELNSSIVITVLHGDNSTMISKIFHIKNHVFYSAAVLVSPSEHADLLCMGVAIVAAEVAVAPGSWCPHGPKCPNKRTTVI